MDKKTLNIKWIAILVSICMLVILFLPIGNMTIKDLSQDTKEVVSVTVWQVISESQSLTPVSELGQFSGISFMSGLYLVIFVFPIAAFLLLASFIRPKLIRRWMISISGVIIALIPIFTYFQVNGHIKVINEVSKYTLNPTVILAIIMTGFILWLNSKVDETSIHDPLNNKYILYIMASTAIIIGCFLPAFGVDIKSGLNNFKTYEYTFFNLMSMASNLEVMVIFSSFKLTALSFMKVFYIIPVLAGLTIIFAARHHYYAKWSAGILALFSITYYAMMTSILKANYGIYDGVRRIFTGSGSLIILASLILLVIVVLSNKREVEIVDFLDRSRANTRLNYGLLGIVGLILSQLPQTGITTSTLTALGLKSVEPVKHLRVLFNQHQIAGLTGNLLTYVGYIIPFTLIILLVSVILKRRLVAKAMALVSGILLIVTPLINRSVVNNLISEFEVGQFRQSYVWMILIGFILIVNVISDRNTPVAISNSKSKVSRTTQSLLLAGFGVIQLYPLFWLILASFMSEKEMFSGKVFALPEVWHAEHYSKVLFGTRVDETIMEAIKRVTNETDFGAVIKFITGNTADGNIVRYFGNSLFVTGVSIIIVLICAAMVSYALKRIEWKGRGIVYGFFILGMMIPVHVALAPLYITFSKIGILGSLWSLIIPYAGFGLSFAIIVLSSFMESIPKAIEESATIDGAGRFTIFWRIILPMIKPALSTVTIFTFMGSWNELMFASIFINKGMNRTITVGINHLATAQYNTEYGLIFAGLVVASLPTLLFYLFASEQVQKSLVVGAVKE